MKERTSRACKRIIYISDDNSKDYGAQNKEKVGRDAKVEMEEDSNDSGIILDNVSYEGWATKRTRMASKIFHWTVSQSDIIDQNISSPITLLHQILVFAMLAIWKGHIPNSLKIFYFAAS